MAELTIRKIVLFILVGFVLIFGILNVKNLDETSSEALFLKFQQCELLNSQVFQHCNVVDCSLGCEDEEEQTLYEQQLAYAKQCEVEEVECSSFQTKILSSSYLNSALSEEQRSFLLENSKQCEITKVSDLDSSFITKVETIADEIGASSDDLLKVIQFESGNTFCSCALNQAGSGAVGLIQFIPKIAQELGTSSKELCLMEEEKQLDYVLTYFNNKRNGKVLDSIEDLYMAVLWPAAIGKSTSYVLFEEGSIYYSQNSGLDSNGDKKITVSEASGTVSGQILIP